MARHIKSIPLMEALTGSSTDDLFRAIFDIELDEADYGLFLDESDGDADLAALSSCQSRENLCDDLKSSPVPKIRTRYPSSLGGTPVNARSGDPGSSNTVFPGDQSSPSSINQSPLTRLFRSRLSSTTGIIQPAASSEAAVAAAQLATRAAMNTETSARHIETLLETVRDLPVHKLKEEMKELQVRFFFFFFAWFSSSFIVGSSGTYRESFVNANPWHAERNTSTRLNAVNRLT